MYHLIEYYVRLSMRRAVLFGAQCCWKSSVLLSRKIVLGFYQKGAHTRAAMISRSARFESSQALVSSVLDPSSRLLRVSSSLFCFFLDFSFLFFFFFIERIVDFSTTIISFILSVYAWNLSIRSLRFVGQRCGIMPAWIVVTRFLLSHHYLNGYIPSSPSFVLMISVRFSAAHSSRGDDVWSRSSNWTKWNGSEAKITLSSQLHANYSFSFFFSTPVQNV